MTDAKPTILFVCTHNAGRSALAAALARAQFGDRIDAESAGVDPQSAPSEVTIASLAELGIDDSHHIPTGLTPERVAAADIVVAMKPGLSIPQVDGVPIQLCRDRRQGHGHPTTSLTKTSHADVRMFSRRLVRRSLCERRMAGRRI